MRTRKPPPVLDPEVTARAVAQMALGRASAHRERLAAQTALLERLADMPLEELSRHVNGRQWMAAVFAASGSTEPEIGRALGLKGGAVSAHRLRKHPVVVRLVELIRAHQLALVLRGEFGVQSQARAAAPAVMQNLTELAGAAVPADETERARSRGKLEVPRAVDATDCKNDWAPEQRRSILRLAALGAGVLAVSFGTSEPAVAFSTPITHSLSFAYADGRGAPRRAALSRENLTATPAQR